MTDIMFIATENSDLVEGKGHEVVIGYYSNEKAAVDAVQGRGVMGVGTGDVYCVPILDEFQVDSSQPRHRITQFYRQHVYGYRKDWRGQWGHGWVDNRDAPVNDPEYQTYLRLKRKFELD